MKMRFGLAVVVVVCLLFAAAYAQETQELKPVFTSGDVQTFELPSWGNGTPALMIDVPTGVEIRFSKGPDFDVYSIVETGSSASASMGIYVGHNPSTDWPASASKKPARIGSTAVVWRSWHEHQEHQTILHREALINDFFPCSRVTKSARKLPPEYPPAPPPPGLPDPGCGLKIHVFVQGTQAQHVDRMAGWTSTLRKKS